MKPGFMWVTEGVKAVDTRSALRCYPQSGVNMLTDVQSKKAQPSTSHYKLPDERGLHLLVKTNGSKLWQLRYRYQGKEKTASLGQYPDVSLAEAREKREAAGYNIRWLLRMIVKKGIGLFLRLLQVTGLAEFARALRQMLMSNQLKSSPI